MTRLQRIENKGYKVTHNVSYYDGEQTVNGVTAYRGFHRIGAASVTALHRKLFGY